jgi:hypothetical protein
MRRKVRKVRRRRRTNGRSGWRRTRRLLSTALL